MCRAATASTSRAWATPTWSRCTRWPGSPACRCSSSAAAATTATGPSSCPTPRPSRRRRRCWAPSSASSTTTCRRRPWCWSATSRRSAPCIAEALSIKAGRKVEIHRPQRGEKRGAVEHAATNAREALERRMAEGTAQQALLPGVARCSTCPPRRSASRSTTTATSMGTNAYGVMVAAGPSGFLKQAYRKFSIKRHGRRRGDDFAMMREVFERRFGRALKEDPERESGTWPDLVLIDGGARPAQRRAGDPGGAGRARHPAGRHRQGPGPRRRARMVPPAPGASPSSCRRATPCCTTCSGCATRRTASPSPPTAPAGPRR